MIRTIVLTALFATILAVSAPAQLIVGNDQGPTATIYNIDVTTGVATPIYSSTGPDGETWGMAYDSATNTLYWNSGVTLFSSPLGPALTPTNLGAITGGFVPVSLAFSNGHLYGTANLTPESVYEIDLVTLASTVLYTYPSAFDFGGLDFDESTGILYGLTDAAPAPDVRGLYSIDFVAMTQTFIAPYPAGETDIDGLAVANGLAYYVSDGPNTVQTSIYVFDIATGQQVGTLPSPFTGNGIFSAATWAGNSTRPATPYCFGDGSGTACPCGNAGAAGTAAPARSTRTGGNLTANGIASIANDTLVLQRQRDAEQLGAVLPGHDADGRGRGRRVRRRPALRGRLDRPARDEDQRRRRVAVPGRGRTLPICIKGVDAAGNVRTYQCWYRNAAAFCTPRRST